MDTIGELLNAYGKAVSVDDRDELARRIVHLTESGLRGKARFLVHDDALADDFVQETYVRVLGRIDRMGLFQSTTPNGGNGYLYQTLTNLICAYFNAKKKAQEARGLPVLLGTIKFDPEDPIWTNKREDDGAQDRINELRPYLDKLTSEEAQLLHLKVVEGLTHKQVGESLGIPKGTAGRRFKEIRDKLRASLGLNQGGAA